MDLNETPTSPHVASTCFVSRDHGARKRLTHQCTRLGNQKLVTRQP